MTIDEQLKTFQKTKKFNDLVIKKAKSDATFGSNFNGAGSQKNAIKYGEQMKEILRSEIIDVKSTATNESFLDHIIVNEEFVTGMGWVINVLFDEDLMYRDSLYPDKYPDGVLLNEIFNEGYSAKDYVYGTWHEENIRSKKQRTALYFIQRAVDRFNAKQKGKAIAQYNSKYTGGTL